MRDETRGTLAILASAFGYGTLAVLAKLAFEAGVEVLPLLAWRFSIGSALVWLFVLATRRPVPRARRLGGVVGLGCLYAGASLAFMVGLERIPASLASLVFFTYPIVTVLLARVFASEPLTSRRLLSLAAVTAGCSLTVGGGPGGGDALGVAWILVGVLLLSTFIVSSHGTLARVPALGGTAILLTTTGLVLAAVAFAAGGVGVPVAPRTVLLLGAIGTVSTAIPVALFLLAIQWIGPARAAILSTLEPIVTVLLALLYLNESMTATQLAGGGLILAGVAWLRLERAPGEPVPHSP